MIWHHGLGTVRDIENQGRVKKYKPDFFPLSCVNHLFPHVRMSVYLCHRFLRYSYCTSRPDVAAIIHHLAYLHRKAGCEKDDTNIRTQWPTLLSVHPGGTDAKTMVSSRSDAAVISQGRSTPRHGSRHTPGDFIFTLAIPKTETVTYILISRYGLSTNTAPPAGVRLTRIGCGGECRSVAS